MSRADELFAGTGIGDGLQPPATWNNPDVVETGRAVSSELL